MQYSPSFCLLFQPITFHVTLLFYSQIHSVENVSFTYKWIGVLGDSLVSKPQGVLPTGNKVVFLLDPFQRSLAHMNIKMRLIA